MPTLNLPQKKTKNTNRQNTDSRKLRQKAYNTTAWKKLRESYIKNHPLCEECLDKGKVTAAEDVHHITSPFSNGEINYHLLLDSNNLKSLCKECHAAIHNKQQGKITIQDVLRQLADLLDPTITDEELENDNTGDNRKTL